MTAVSFIKFLREKSPGPQSHYWPRLSQSDGDGLAVIWRENEGKVAKTKTGCGWICRLNTFFPLVHLQNKTIFLVQHLQGC